MKILSVLAIVAPLVSGFAPTSSLSASRVSTELNAAIQFIRGLDEKDVPNVKLTRARDGASGVATFQFSNPNCFDASTTAAGEVTGMFMIDEEGELSTNSVNARFANGKPQDIEATYVMTSPSDWDRFMRFSKYNLILLDLFARTNERTNILHSLSPHKHNKHTQWKDTVKPMD